MKIFLFSALVLVAGMLAPTQAGINAQLSQVLRSHFLAALVSFFVGTMALLTYVLVIRVPWPPLESLSKAPWWIWCGGFCGAFLVTVTIAAAPKLGATTMFAFFLAGQMLASIILDHFGLFSYPIHPFNIMRLVGVLLLCGGIMLIKHF
jgi:transporter family-2 protein